MEWSINNIFEKTGSDKYEMYIGGDNNFRKEIYPLYKANRASMKRPMWLEDCREHLMVKWGAKIVNGMEVDDMCGIRMSCVHSIAPICVSLDKDLLQIPGRHYNFVNDEHTIVSELEGMRRFYKQIILGDLSDNVPGYDGKYRDRVPKFILPMMEVLDSLEEETPMYEHVCAVYGGDIERVDLHASLLYVLREEEKYWVNPLKRNHLSGQKHDDIPSSLLCSGKVVAGGQPSISA